MYFLRVINLDLFELQSFRLCARRSWAPESPGRFRRSEIPAREIIITLINLYYRVFDSAPEGPGPESPGRFRRSEISAKEIIITLINSYYRVFDSAESTRLCGRLDFAIPWTSQYHGLRNTMDFAIQ